MPPEQFASEHFVQEQFAEWTYYPDLLERPVPRYTSYPTAAEFVDGDYSSAQVAALGAVRDPVSLYLHIPFCEEICWYCGCNTGAANRTQRVSTYLEALHREIELVARTLDPSVEVQRIAFGGGSPNAIQPTDFVRLIDKLIVSFRIPRPVFSIELDPRSLSPAWFLAIRGIGIVKASLGVQTFDPKIQAAIGRVQPRETIAGAVEGLRAAGVESINFDLMYGLPFQDEAILADTIDQSIALGADRIALFGYAHVPHMIPRQRRIDASALPDQRTRFRMAALGYERLVAAGYQPVGFDHFALPRDGMAKAAQSGSLRRNFQGFTDDTAPVLIGIGASAISELPGLFVQNDKNAGQYRLAIDSGRFTGNKGYVLSDDDRRRGALISSLLCKGEARVDPDLVEATRESLRPFVERGLLSIDGGHLILAPGSEPYARSIAVAFDAYRTTARQFSSAV